MNMFDVKILDTGDNPANVIMKIEKCLRACLKSRSRKILDIDEFKESHDDLRSDLMSCLGAPHVMGSMFKGVYVDLVDFGEPQLFIIVKTAGTWTGNNWVRGKDVILLVGWKQPTGSLKEMCLEAIKESLSTRNEVMELGLPRVLELDLCRLF